MDQIGNIKTLLISNLYFSPELNFSRLMLRIPNCSVGRIIQNNNILLTQCFIIPNTSSDYAKESFIWVCSFQWIIWLGSQNLSELFVHDKDGSRVKDSLTHGTENHFFELVSWQDTEWSKINFYHVSRARCFV